MTLPKLDAHWVALIGGVALCVVAVLEALVFHRASGLSDYDKILIGAGAAAFGIGGAYVAGLKTPYP